MDAGTGLGGLALVVSIAVALLQWRQTNRLDEERTNREQEANAIQERLAAVEEDRRSEELEPRLDARFVREGGRSRIVITNRSRPDWDDLSWSVIDPPGPPPIVRSLIFGLERRAAWEGSTGPLRRGADTELEIDEDARHRGGVLRLRCVATAGHRTAETVVEVEIIGHARIGRVR